MQLTKQRYPFTIGAMIYDYYSGQPITGYLGKVRVNDALFYTGVDRASGERFWNCIDPAHYRF